MENSDHFLAPHFGFRYEELGLTIDYEIRYQVRQEQDEGERDEE